MKKRYLADFIRENKLIFYVFILSIFIVVTYMLSMNCPEWFNGAELWFNLLFQLSIGFMINFMFYITQIYIPNKKHNTSARKCIYIRIQNICKNMNNNFIQLGEIYLNKLNHDNYTQEELKIILDKLNFADEINVINISNNNHFTVGEWIRNCIHLTTDEIDKLYKYYPNHITSELMEVLEDILKSNYHDVMSLLLNSNKPVTFSCNDDYFLPYYNLLLKLRDIGEKDFNY